MLQFQSSDPFELFSNIFYDKNPIADFTSPALITMNLRPLCMSFLSFAYLCQAWPGEDKLSKKECKQKADQGDCEVVPQKLFMKENCPATCREPYRKGVRFLQDGETSFFDLSAKTAEGKLIDFDRFDGYVTLVADESSLCGFTNKDFGELNRMHRAYRYLMEIVIFPTNQLEEHTGQDCPGVKEFKNYEGLDFMTMETVHVNGPNTHPVYKYLKERHHFDDLDPKYVTYFIVSPNGNVQVVEDLSPLKLFTQIDYALKELK